MDDFSCNPNVFLGKELDGISRGDLSGSKSAATLTFSVSRIFFFFSTVPEIGNALGEKKAPGANNLRC